MAVVAPLIGGLAGGWVASSLGYAVGSIGYAIGTGVGSMLGSALVPQPGVEGPRAGDNTVQTSTYGASIPVVYGTVRISGNVIWSSGIREVKSTSEQGKGGGQEVTTYAYFADWAVGLCEGEIGGVRRVWLDADLVYDATSTDADVIAASAAFLNSMTVYAGSETQTADPTIQAAVGVADCPAYRGLAYLVFEDIALNEFGNRIPNVMVELFRCVEMTSPDAVFPDPGGELGFVIDKAWRCMYRLVGGNYPPYADDQRSCPSAHATAAVGSLEGDLFSAPLTITGSIAYDVTFANLNCGGDYNEYTYTLIPQIHTRSSDWYIYAWSHTGDSSTLAEGYWDNTQSSGTLSLSAVDNWAYAPNISSGLVEHGDNRVFEDYRTWMGVWHKDAGKIDLRDLVDNHGGVSIEFGFVPGLGQFGSANVVITCHDYYQLAVRLVSVSGSGPTQIFKLQVSATMQTGSYGTQTWPVLESNADLIPGEAYHFTLDFVGTTATLTQIGHSSAVFTASMATPTTGPFVPLSTITDTKENRVLRFGGGQTVSGDGAAYELTPEGVPFIGWLGDIRITTGDGTQVFIQDDSNLVRESTCSIDRVWVAAIVDDLCDRLAVPKDTSGIPDSVIGYSVSRQMTARAAIEPLQRAYFFDAVEASGQVCFVPRGQAVSASYDDDDLGAGESASDIPRLAVLRGNETELPRKVFISYMDYDRDHEVNIQSSPRLTTLALSETTIECAIVMTADDAAQKSEITLINTWIGREQVDFTLPYSEIARQPTDVVDLSVAGETWRVRITKIDYSLPGALKCVGTVERSDTWTSTAVGVVDSEYVASPAPVLNAALTGHVLDIPLLSDLHDPAGFYVATGTAGAWGGGKLLLSTDGGTTYSEAATLNLCTIGTALSVLADHAPETIDRAHTVRVSLLRADQTLAGIGAATALTHTSNLALLGSEILVFEAATLVTPGVYDLSILHRGLRGTDINASAHAAGERFVLLDGNVQRVALADTLIGSTVHAKFVQVGELASNVTAASHFHVALGHECYSPVHLAASDNGDGTWDIAWMRRNRLDGEWRDYVETAMSEATERYLLAVFNGATLMQTLDTSNSYANAITASTGWTIEICQISAKTGPGFTGAITL